MNFNVTMIRVNNDVYLNGQWLPVGEAKVSVEDRSCMFGDAVYEVLRYYDGKPFAPKLHVERMRHSLDAVSIPLPEEFERLPQISDELVRRNAMPHCKAYWQISRGVAPREHEAPAGLKPTVLVMTYEVPPLNVDAPAPRKRAILTPDLRWLRCDIKAVTLLANVIAKTHALRAGAQEAILHRDGVVTEGSATTVFIVRGGVLMTHPLSPLILGGITRATLLELARKHNIPAQERPFTVDQLLTADEVFISGTTTHVGAVTEIDRRTVGEGDVGPVTARLNRLLIEHILATVTQG
ncbi:MAG: D-amino acid aminotransferase [Phycisphaeraceae bacterium]|nr:D-amino acid aminotransferase [Phycisphaeraceae bacterium]